MSCSKVESNIATKKSTCPQTTGKASSTCKTNSAKEPDVGKALNGHANKKCSGSSSDKSITEKNCNRTNNNKAHNQCDKKFNKNLEDVKNKLKDSKNTKSNKDNSGSRPTCPKKANNSQTSSPSCTAKKTSNSQTSSPSCAAKKTSNSQTSSPSCAAKKASNSKTSSPSCAAKKASNSKTSSPNSNVASSKKVSTSPSGSTKNAVDNSSYNSNAERKTSPSGSTSGAETNNNTGTDGLSSYPYTSDIDFTNNNTDYSTDNSSLYNYTDNLGSTGDTGYSNNTDYSTGNSNSYPYSDNLGFTGDTGYSNNTDYTNTGYSNDTGYSNNTGYTNNTSYTNNQGSVVTSTDFSDGKFPGTAPTAQEPTQILTDSSGNSFMRLTANYGDHEGIPDGSYPDRVRTTMYVAGEHWNQPELDNSNNHMNYSADIRFIDDKATRGYSNNSFMELFQGSDAYKSTGYDANNSAGGPPVRLIRKDDGTVCLETVQENGAGKDRTVNQYDLGYFAPGEFHNFSVDAVWSPDSNGSLIVSVDGQEKIALAGNTYYNPIKSNLVPAMKVGLYGSNAVGSVDVDNVEVDNLS